MKIAHVIKSLNPGGVETWLKDLSLYNSSQDELHFLLHNTSESFYEDEVKKNGSIINRIPLRRNIVSFSYRFFCLLRKEKFDVVHSHVNLTSGWFLFLSLLAGVKVRVAHCHNDKRSEYKNINLRRHIYNSLMKLFVHFFSNRKIAVSRDCSGSMFYEKVTKVSILPCGLNFKKDFKKINKSDFGFNEDDIVLLHVGRFVPQKNHEFILNLMVGLKKYSNIKLLLIGEGDKLLQSKKFKESYGLKNVLFLGVSGSVQDIMYGVADYFILPSKFEGLGLVAIESQSCNVHTIVSEKVPRDVKISDFIDFLPIETTDIWVDKIISSIDQKKHIIAKQKNFDNSKFTIENNSKVLSLIYKGLI